MEEIDMNSEWSLDVLYKGFDDPKFSEDLTSFEKKAKELDEISKTLSHENEKEDLIRIVKALEEFELLEKHLSCFGFFKPIHEYRKCESGSSH